MLLIVVRFASDVDGVSTPEYRKKVRVIGLEFLRKRNRLRRAIFPHLEGAWAPSVQETLTLSTARRLA